MEPAGCPPTVAVPREERTNPSSILMVVVLPAPLGPRGPKISPFSTSKETSWTARTGLPQKPTRKVLERFSARTTACGGKLYAPSMKGCGRLARAPWGGKEPDVFRFSTRRTGGFRQRGDGFCH